MSYLLIHPEDLENLLTMEDAVQAVDLAYGGATKFPVIAAPRRRVHSPAGVRLSTFPGGVPQLGIIGVDSFACCKCGLRTADSGVAEHVFAFVRLPHLRESLEAPKESFPCSDGE